MERITRTTIKAATMLFDGKPVFVSLVKHGANQIPFRTLKADDPDTAITMSKSATTVKKGLQLDAGVEISRMVLTTAKFADEAAVQTYLKDQGFANCQIEKKGDTWEIPGVDESEFENGKDGVSAVEFKEDGVTVYVGKIKGDNAASTSSKSTEQPPAAGGAASATPPAAEPARHRTPPAESAPAAKSATGAAASDAPAFLKTAKGEGMVKKWSYCAAMYADGKTLKEVLEEATQDGIPLGYGEMMASFSTALGNVVKSGDSAGITGLTSELGTYLTELVKLTAGMTDEQKAAKKDFLDALLAPAPASTTKTAEQQPPAADHTATIKALEQRIQALEGKTGDFALKADVTALSTKADDVGNRVTKMERLRVSRKSAPDAGTPAPGASEAAGGSENQPPAQKSATELASMSRSQKNALGIRE